MQLDEKLKSSIRMGVMAAAEQNADALIQAVDRTLASSGRDFSISEQERFVKAFMLGISEGMSKQNEALQKSIAGIDRQKIVREMSSIFGGSMGMEAKDE